MTNPSKLQNKPKSIIINEIGSVIAKAKNQSQMATQIASLRFLFAFWFLKWPRTGGPN